ncbi:glycosyltransferase [Polaribacter sp. Q13]|uniref:glycosyltransferase n=1 Tax=Polaribacter sp. Q13 TaxID=2806551 RepID=UPI00193B01B8|nr:glycosyltransferase [Polaribacter sp. Q13]QVY66623.1 glycosyltransferase [Polaribacter sp. Q13]
MQKKVCCIFNYPPHYRKSIYELMDKELGCDFYFGKNVPGTLKAMDVSSLNGFRKKFRNIVVKKRIIWQTGVLKLLFKNYKNYILTVDTACLSSWIFIYTAKLLGKNVFFWTHGCNGKESSLHRIKNKLYFGPSKGLLLYGEYAKSILMEIGYKPEKLYVIANSLDYENQLKIRKSLSKNETYKKYFKNDFPVLLFIGRLEKKKKLSMILEVMKVLGEENLNVNCIYIGEGNEKDILVNKAKKDGLEQYSWFYGACYDEYEVGNLIYNADICLSPGNVGLTAIHSLSFGTPVITHSNFSNQMPEYESITKGVSGAFFEENNLESLKNSIKDWLKKHPTKNNELVDNCFQIIDEKYNPYYQLKVLKKAIFNEE